MIVALAAVALVSLVLLAIAVGLRGRLATERRRAEELTVELGDALGARDEARSSAEEAATRATRSAAAAKEADEARLAATRRAEVAEQRATAAAAAADQAMAAAEVAENRALAAATEKAAAERDASAARDRLELTSPEGLWALERRRIERLWRDRVALPHDAGPHLDGVGDPIAEAARVLCDASREETGVVVDLHWKAAPVTDDAVAVSVLRVIEELVAVAWAADGADLDVLDDGAGLAVVLRAEPSVDAPADLAPALAPFGWVVHTDDDGALRVEIPRRSAAPARPEPAA